jgi:C-terminal processing protease CtpA/Prc
MVRMVQLLSVFVLILGSTTCLGAPAPEPVDNLRAFAKLFGYVRYFYPGDEAADLDWEAFAAFGTTQVRGAGTPEELQSTLQDLFLPFAPTLQVYSTDGPAPPLPSELSPADSADLQVVAWQHSGVGFGSANSIYRSVRLNRETTLTGGAANAVLTQRVDVGELSGKEVRLTGMGKAMEPGARVHLWLRVDLPGGGRGFFDNMMDRPVVSTDWTEMEIEGPVAQNAVGVFLGAILLGGSTDIDNLRLEVREGDRWVPTTLQNGDFEEGEEGNLEGWFTPSQGWVYAPTEGEAPHGDRFLRIAPGRSTISGRLFPHAPSVGEVVEKDLGRGLMARIPLALYSRDGHTLGTPDPSRESALSTSLAEVGLSSMTADAEALRLADVVMAWNVFQHFYPYFDVVDSDWDGVLTTALVRALSDRTDEDFLFTLRWMVAQLQDGHGSVSGPMDPLAGFPIRVDWVEDQVVIVATTDAATFQVGDVIERVNGRPAGEVVEELAETYSGSPQWRRWRALAQFGWGPQGSEGTLDIRRGSDALTVTQIRGVNQPPAETRPENIEELEPGIFYVNLDLVEIAAFQEQVEELAVADGVVFDLRGYPNGNHLALTYLTDQNLNSAFWNVPQIIYPDHDGEAHFSESRWDLPPSEPRFQGKIVFLTDGRAISYAESVMGIVEHYRLGEIVGQTTAGANGNVNPFTLPGGYRFSWTGMRVIKHDRSQHHVVGIQPTVPMVRTIQGVREGRDELLERALEVIRGG